MKEFSVSHLCPSCFRETFFNGVCSQCGFCPELTEDIANALSPYTLLKQKYLLGRGLGAGGFGITYKAKDMASGSLCCIKEYFPSEIVDRRDASIQVALKAPENQSEFSTGLHRFLEEANTLQELRDNVSVVNVFDSFEANGTAYFVMELLNGCNLREFQSQHTPQQNMAAALQVMFLIGSALAEVHRFGLIHGDISPENIIITYSGDIKLIDFGAARSFEHGSIAPGEKIYLKPSYAPYEQYSAKPQQGPWTDIYALAATFYATLSGKHMVDAISRSKGTAYSPLYQLNPAVSKELSDVIDHALAFDYHDRYHSVIQFLGDLERTTTPNERNVDLQALMRSAEMQPEQKAGHNTNTGRRAVAAQNMPSSRKIWPFSARKHSRMAYLELCINHRSTRRWMLTANQDIQIGRRAASDVMMPADNNISRDHCKIYFDAKKGRFLLTDTRSKFGTYLKDGTRLHPDQPVSLRPNDTFFIVSPQYMCRVVIEE